MAVGYVLWASTCALPLRGAPRACKQLEVCFDAQPTEEQVQGLRGRLHLRAQPTEEQEGYHQAASRI